MRGGDGTRLVVGAGGNDYFGVRIAVSRDGATIAVGAAGEESGSVDTPSDNSLQGAGAAYVFQ